MGQEVQGTARYGDLVIGNHTAARMETNKRTLSKIVKNWVPAALSARGHPSITTAYLLCARYLLDFGIKGR